MKAKRIEVFTRTDPLNPDDPRENRRVVIEPILPPDGCPRSVTGRDGTGRTARFSEVQTPATKILPICNHQEKVA
jgi:hypothetical protein